MAVWGKRDVGSGRRKRTHGHFDFAAATAVRLDFEPRPDRGDSN